jgi:hypothetical protein
MTDIKTAAAPDTAAADTKAAETVIRAGLRTWLSAHPFAAVGTGFGTAMLVAAILLIL